MAQDDTPRRLAEAIGRLAKEIRREVRFMEVCGTHTMAIYRAGLPSLLPENVRLLSGPGCPVCVTPMGYMDAAVSLARRSDTTVTTFGDMMRVPGSESSLERERAAGADIRVVYSPMDALRMAEETSSKQVVFLAVGFETTAPAIAITVAEAHRRGVDNFSLLAAHKLIPPALEALLSDEETAIDGFILPGHVSAILGTKPYEFIPSRFGKPAVIAGFDPVDILQAIFMLLAMIAEGRPQVRNQYTTVVRPEGNPTARRNIEECMEPCDSEWRGLGSIPKSGLRLRSAYERHDAAKRFGLTIAQGREPPGCRCGDVLRGAAAPEDCPLFGRRCTPSDPVGACMVSSEGTCAAHYKYGKR